MYCGLVTSVCGYGGWKRFHLPYFLSTESICLDFTVDTQVVCCWPWWKSFEEHALAGQRTEFLTVLILKLQRGSVICRSQPCWKQLYYSIWEVQGSKNSLKRDWIVFLSLWLWVIFFPSPLYFLHIQVLLQDYSEELVYKPESKLLKRLKEEKEKIY